MWGLRGDEALPASRAAGEANQPADKDSPVCRVCTNREISTWDQEPRGAMSLAWKAKERLKVVKKKNEQEKEERNLAEGTGGCTGPNRVQGGCHHGPSTEDPASHRHSIGRPLYWET